MLAKKKYKHVGTFQLDKKNERLKDMSTCPQKNKNKDQLFAQKKNIRTFLNRSIWTDYAAAVPALATADIIATPQWPPAVRIFFTFFLHKFPKKMVNSSHVSHILFTQLLEIHKHCKINNFITFHRKI